MRTFLRSLTAFSVAVVVGAGLAQVLPAPWSAPAVAVVSAQPPAPSITFLAPYRVSVGGTAVQLTTSANVNGGILLKAICPGETVYWGVSSAVTTANGFPLANGESVPLNVRNANEIYVIASAASQAVAVAPFTSR